MNEIIKEKSCGAVVYWESEGERLYLLEHMQGGHFAMPKGHVEAGESERETAEREIWEETGLRVHVDCTFRAVTSYRPYPGCVKEVVYFLTRAASRETVAQPEEVRAVQWLPLDAALRTLSFENDREILRRAARTLDESAKKF